MLTRQVLLTSLFTTMLPLMAAVADDVRYYEQNGITYQETRRVVQRPVYETKMQTTTQTVYRQQWVTEDRDSVRTTLVPMTQYQCETYMVGRWNPFVEPYWATRLVPQTRWEQRTEVVKMPVTYYRCVPETQTVQVPVSVSRCVQKEVVSRVAITGPRSKMGTGSEPLRDYRGTTASGEVPVPVFSQATAQPSSGAATGPVGGVARLNGDPPRYGPRSAWQIGPATR